MSYSGNPLLFPPEPVSRAGWAGVRRYLRTLLTDADRAGEEARPPPSLPYRLTQTGPVERHVPLSLPPLSDADRVEDTRPHSSPIFR